jgi:hypothetical protein
MREHVRGIDAGLAPVKSNLKRRAMNSLRTLLSTLRHRRSAQATKLVCEASQRARYRFRHSMLGEPGLDEAVRLFGVGR